MFDKNYRPLPSVIGVYCNYSHIRYCFRQKIKQIQHSMIEIRRISRCKYKLCLFDDSCALVDPIQNRFVWTYDYSSSIMALFALLDEVYRFYNYEKDSNYIKNMSDFNDYQTLKKKYHVRKK